MSFRFSPPSSASGSRTEQARDRRKRHRLDAEESGEETKRPKPSALGIGFECRGGPIFPSCTAAPANTRGRYDTLQACRAACSGLPGDIASAVLAPMFIEPVISPGSTEAPSTRGEAALLSTSGAVASHMHRAVANARARDATRIDTMQRLALSDSATPEELSWAAELHVGMVPSAIRRTEFCGALGAVLARLWATTRAPEDLERLWTPVYEAARAAGVFPPMSPGEVAASVLGTGLAPAAAAAVGRWFSAQPFVREVHPLSTPLRSCADPGQEPSTAWVRQLLFDTQTEPLLAAALAHSWAADAWPLWGAARSTHPLANREDGALRAVAELLPTSEQVVDDMTEDERLDAYEGALDGSAWWTKDEAWWRKDGVRQLAADAALQRLFPTLAAVTPVYQALEDVTHSHGIDAHKTVWAHVRTMVPTSIVVHFVTSWDKQASRAFAVRLLTSNFHSFRVQPREVVEVPHGDVVERCGVLLGGDGDTYIANDVPAFRVGFRYTDLARDPDFWQDAVRALNAKPEWWRVGHDVR